MVSPALATAPSAVSAPAAVVAPVPPATIGRGVLRSAATSSTLLL